MSATASPAELVTADGDGTPTGPPGATPPPAESRRRRWGRELFGSPWRALSSVALLALIAWAAVHALDWAVLRAVFRPDADACRAPGQKF